MSETAGTGDDSGVSPLSVAGRGGFLIFGLLLFGLGLAVCRIGWDGFRTGEVAWLSLERDSALRVYLRAVTVLLIGAGPLLIGGAMMGTGILPRKWVNVLVPIAAASLISWGIAIPLAVVDWIARVVSHFY